MIQDLIHNGDFKAGSANWNSASSYPENTIKFYKSEYLNYVTLTIRSTGDPGECYISQSLSLTPNKKYSLCFEGRRTSNVDFWIQISVCGQMLSSPSLKAKVTSYWSDRIIYEFTVPDSSALSEEATIYFVAGSAGGSVWLQNIELLDEIADRTGEFSVLKYIETNEKARIFKTPNPKDNNNYGTIKAGCLFVYKGIEENMVVICYGNKHGESIDAYIRKTECHSSDIDMEAAPQYRMYTIAESLQGVDGTLLGLGGEYCENFIHWLVGATNDTKYLSSCIYMKSEKCGPALKYYIDNGAAGSLLDGTTRAGIQQGDLVYYDVENYGTDQMTAAHVGFVIGLKKGDNNTFYSIEGNVGSAAKIEKCTGNCTTGKVDKHKRTVSILVRPFGNG